MSMDSDPNKKLQGAVIKVANVGEQRPNSDAKVFEVLVEIEGSDAALRPAMTTSNKITAKVLNDVAFVPLEALHTQHDTITYVFKKEGIRISKQEVVVGETNANEAVIEAGLEDEEVALLPQLNGKRQKKEENQQVKKPETAKANLQ
jgi:HlyD family secretion protein